MSFGRADARRGQHRQSRQGRRDKKAVEGLWVGHVNAVRKVVVAEIAGADTKTAEGEVVANCARHRRRHRGLLRQAGRRQAVHAARRALRRGQSLSRRDGRERRRKQSAATDQITANADALATFLSGANPYLPKETLSEMLLAHGSHHISQIQQLAAKDSAGEAKTAAHMKSHIIMVADALTDALAKQFPEKF